MVEDAYVNHMPTNTGGRGKTALRAFYRDDFIPSWPDDLKTENISRVVGAGKIADELIRAGYSTKRADQSAHQLLRNIEISKAIETYRAKILARTDITNERWLREAASQTFFDPAKVFDENGCLLPIHDIPPEARQAIAGTNVLAQTGSVKRDLEVSARDGK